MESYKCNGSKTAIVFEYDLSMLSSWLLSFLQKRTIKTLSLAKIHTWYIWFIFLTLEFQIESEHTLTGTNFFEENYHIEYFKYINITYSIYT